jgi:hypothetical protein
MAGILNNKERMLDFIMTEEGKRQASSGQMKIEYAAFTDMHTFYTPTGSTEYPGVSENASSRLYFEASNRYQDVIVPELEAGNSLRPFKTEDFQFDGKIVASGTFRLGFQKRYTILTGSKITDISDRSLSGITRNFNDLRILGTVDPFSSTTGFKTSTQSGSFYYWDDMPMGQSTNGHVSLEAAESLFADSRFSHFANFSYLPPVNKPTPGSKEGKPLGMYPKLNEKKSVAFKDIEEKLKSSQKVTIDFNDTSRENNLIGQFFEFSSVGIEKLSIIDFGSFDDDDPFSPGKHVYFIGKILRDANGSETFLNIFTVVFD